MAVLGFDNECMGHATKRNLMKNKTCNKA